MATIYDHGIEPVMHTARDGNEYQVLHSCWHWDSHLIVFGLPDCGHYEFAIFEHASRGGRRIAESHAGYGCDVSALRDAILFAEEGKVREPNLCQPFALVDAGGSVWSHPVFPLSGL